MKIELIIGIVIYKALCFDVAQGRMNGAPNENRTDYRYKTSLEWSILFIESAVNS